MNLKFSVFLMLIFSYTILKAQEVITTTGGNASGSGGTVSYTIGQVVYTTNTGTNGSVIQGVQQPFEISVITGYENVKNVNLNMTTYPNPTTNTLTLRIDNVELINYSLEVFDMNGKLLISKTIEETETFISMVDLQPANYIFKVLENKKEVKVFKIIKN